MRTMLFTILVAAYAFAQQPAAPVADGTFHFTSPMTPQNMQEAATILRTVADIPQLSIDAPDGTITFHGPADKVALGEWILGELDRPGGETQLHEYKMGNGEVARVNFLLPAVATPQGMQEILTVLRTVADIQMAFNYTSRLAIVLRAKEPDTAFAEWIVDQLNQAPQQKPDTTPRQYSVTSSNPRSGNAARVNFLASVSTTRGMQEILSTLRAVAEIQKIFTYSGGHALILRSDDTGIARAEWLIQSLDQLPGQASPGAHVFTTPNADDVTRVFYISNATAQGLQTALTAIRTEARTKKAFSTLEPASTIVVRGTADQVEAAAQVIAAGNGLAMLR